MKAFPSKLRSQIRRPQKEGMTARVGGIELLGEFYRVFSRNMRDLGTPVYGKAFFRTILETFPKETAICSVSWNENVVAAGLVYAFREVIEIPWASSDRRYDRLSPNMLLYSTVLEYACQHGYKVFDFGRSSVDSGTYRFKQQWGAQQHQLYWYYWLAAGQDIPQLNPENPKYKAAIALWQYLPLPLTNFLGPHIVKYLP
jgi:FemAB-related protein (PEP-CTERM system-associated)